MTAPTATPAAAPTRLPSVELNRILQKLDLTFLSDEMLAMPTRYYASVSVVCDIVCPFCPRQYYGELVDSGVMKYEAFETIAPHLAYADFVGMFGLGEPFLHKDFYRFLEAAKRTGAFVTTNTHGMSLDDATIERLLDSDLDELNCSMDGHDKRLFEFLREGAVFEEVVAKLKRFVSRRRERGQTKPELQIAVTVSRHNVAHMADMVRLARDIGADKISFSNLIIIDPDNRDLSVVNTPLFDKNLAKARKTAERAGLPLVYFFQNPFPWLAQPVGVASQFERFGCFEAWRSLTIERRGQTRPCCYLEGEVGNAFDLGIDELRNTEEFRELRRELIEGRPNRFCLNCGNLRGVTAGHVEQHLAEAEELLAGAATLNDDERAWAADLIADYRTRATAAHLQRD